MRKKINCILLVDDDSLDNFFHKIIISKMDIAENIHMAENGIKALEYLRAEKQNPPELMFLDINMPKMNGWEFLEEYRKLDEGQKSKTVIMMLTTSLNPADESRSRKIAEISGFKVKPLSIDIVTDVLEQYFPGVYLDMNKVLE